MEGPFYGPSEHKVAGLSDVIVFDCCCVGAHVDLVAFKISYGDMHTHTPTEEQGRGTNLYVHSHTLTHSHPNVHANHFAFQKNKIAQGDGRGSMASGFPKSACEVNES